MLRGAKDKKELEGQLAEARQRIAELENDVAQSATRDSLTPNLLTLRAFNSQLELDVERAQRYGRPLSLAVLDIDGFGDFNVEHGYEAGDALLIEVARTISDQTRVNDIACRVGNDEFGVLYPETRAKDARLGLERMVKAISVLESGGWKGMTVSAGLVPLAQGQEPERFLAAGHTALEQARTLGGGRIVESESASEVGRDAPKLSRDAAPSVQAEESGGAAAAEPGPPASREPSPEEVGAAAEAAASAALEASEHNGEPAEAVAVSEPAPAGPGRNGSDPAHGAEAVADPDSDPQSTQESDEEATQETAQEGAAPTGEEGTAEAVADVDDGSVPPPGSEPADESGLPPAEVIEDEGETIEPEAEGEAEAIDPGGEAVEPEVEATPEAVEVEAGVEGEKPEPEATEPAEEEAAEAEAEQPRTTPAAPPSEELQGAVTEGAGLLATALELSPEEVEMARAVAYLDNLGAGASGEQAVQVVNGLDPEAWERVRSDRAAAAEVVAGLPGLEAVAETLRALGAWWDGKGQPEGLKGAEIPVAARVVAGVAAYHRLTAAAPSGAGLSRDEAIREVARGSGSRFDPAVVDKLIKYAFGRLGRAPAA